MKILQVLAAALLQHAAVAFLQPIPARPRQNVKIWAAVSGESSLKGLEVAIVGGGPSGLLLAHHVLSAGAKVSVFESRPRPVQQVDAKETRAYALGVGMRGRTAIQSVDDKASLWQAVKRVGFASERFHLHVGPLRLRLRDGDGNKQAREQEQHPAAEPSMLLYQTDLCRVLADELEARWKGPQLNLSFDTAVTSLDLAERSLTTSKGTKQWFDVVVGCDGVNSAVRQAMDEEFAAFETTRTELPGELKVARLSRMPPQLDPTAVALVLPKAGGCSCFVEPTVNAGCCLLFAGRNASDPLLASSNVHELQQLLVERFPLLDGAPLDEAAEQLAAATTSRAASVVCNTYHYGSAAVLVGDAAHATGGVSGQGVNSALRDAQVLADCLQAQYQPLNKRASLHAALLQYSQRQVPEGHALYDLSFGPKPRSWFTRLRFAAATLRDSVWRGRWGLGNLPLQTLLTTSLVPFAEIRRQRDRYYEDDDFPSQTEWEDQLTNLDATTATAQSSTSAATPSLQ